MKKKILCIVLSMAMLLSLSACGSSTSAENEDSGAKASEEIAAAESTSNDNGIDAPAADGSEGDIAAVEEVSDEALVFNGPVTIYDEGDVTVTVNPIENRKFTISFVNNTANTVYFKYDFIKVNGYQIDDAGASTVDANGTYDKYIGLDYFFDALDTEEVSSVELQAKLLDYATQTEIADLGYILIQGDAYGKEFADLVSDEEMLVYSDNKVLAYIDPVLTTTEVDFTMRGFTINNTGEPIWCSAENFSFNGTPYSGLGDFQIAPEGRRFDMLIDQFYYSWIGVSGADEIQTIEFDYTIGADTVHVKLTNNEGILSVVNE